MNMKQKQKLLCELCQAPLDKHYRELDDIKVCEDCFQMDCLDRIGY